MTWVKKFLLFPYHDYLRLSVLIENMRPKVKRDPKQIQTPAEDKWRVSASSYRSRQTKFPEAWIHNSYKDATETKGPFSVALLSLAPYLWCVDTAAFGDHIAPSRTWRTFLDTHQVNLRQHVKYVGLLSSTVNLRLEILSGSTLEVAPNCAFFFSFNVVCNNEGTQAS